MSFYTSLIAYAKRLKLGVGKTDDTFNAYGCTMMAVTTDNNYKEVRVDADGRLQIAPTISTAGDTPNTTAASNVAADLLAASASRKGAMIFNDSAVVLYLGLGYSNVSVIKFSVKVLPGSYYETPFGFTGKISGVCSAVDAGRIMVSSIS